MRSSCRPGLSYYTLFAMRRRPTTALVFLEATVRIPFFVEGVSVEWRPHKVVSVVEHHGESVVSGHYRSLLKTSDGWLHSDDSIVAAPALWSADHEALMYLLWLVPAQEAGGSAFSLDRPL